MKRRTTIEIDEELLGRAKKALGSPTTRATVEEALRLAAERTESAAADRAERQRRFLDHVGELADLEVLGSEQMWR